MPVTTRKRGSKKLGRPPMTPEARAKRTEGKVYYLKLPKGLIPNGVKILQAKSKQELRVRWGINIPDDINWNKAWYERISAILETLARNEKEPSEREDLN